MPGADTRARQLIVAAAAVGLLLRLAFALGYWIDKPLTHDEREYLGLARSLADGRGFTHEPDADTGTSAQFGRAPGYPSFLAAIGAGRSTHSASPVRVKVTQSILGAFVIVLAGWIAKRSAGGRAGAVAAWIAAVYPPLVWTPAYVLSETLYSVVAISAAAVLQLAVDRADAAHGARGGGPLTVAAGALCGLGILIRPALLFFLPLAVLWLVVRRRSVLVLALLAATLAVVAPWTVRNARVYGRFVLVASEGGVTFWTGNHPLARGEGDLAANPDLKRAEIALREAHPGLTPEQLEGVYYRDALRYIAANPGDWVQLILMKAFYTVVPVGPSYALHSSRYHVASVASYLLILPFAIAGFRRLWRLPTRPSALLLLAAASLLMCVVFFPQERFRIPVIDPTLIVCAGGLAARPRA